MTLGYDTTVFDVNLPTTSCIIRGETTKERVQALAKTGRLASAGTVWRFLGTSVYNGEDMLRAREIARENRMRESQEKEDEEDALALRLYGEADLAYVKFKEGGSLLSKLGGDDLKDLVRFICHVEKKKGDTYLKHSSSKKKMLERIARVTPLWTKYFTPPVNEESEEEETAIDSNIENYLQNEDENFNDIIEHQTC